MPFTRMKPLGFIILIVCSIMPLSATQSITAGLIEASSTSSFITSEVETNFAVDTVLGGVAAKCLGSFSGTTEVCVTPIVLLAPGPTLSGITNYHAISTLSQLPASSTGYVVSISTASVTSSTKVIIQTITSTASRPTTSSSTIPPSQTTSTSSGSTPVVVSSGSSVLTSSSAATSNTAFQTGTFAFSCTDTQCEPPLTTWSATCTDAAGCDFTTTLASYSCLTGQSCTVHPVTTTYSCLAQSACAFSASLTAWPTFSPTPKPSTATGPITPPPPGPLSPAATASVCTDPNCCPDGWDCSVPSSEGSAFAITYCPPSSKWTVACMPSAWSASLFDTDIDDPWRCPAYKTCVLPNTDVTTAGQAASSTKSLDFLSNPCTADTDLFRIPVCTSEFPQYTTFSTGSCVVGAAPLMCQFCSDMRIPEDCGGPNGTATPSWCACSADSTGRGNPVTGCANHNSTTTTEKLSSTTITTLVDASWSICDEIETKSHCGTAASCTTTVSYVASSEWVTHKGKDGHTYRSLIWFWSCRSKLCQPSFWAKLADAICHFIGICHIPHIDPDGWIEPPWPINPPVPPPESIPVSTVDGTETPSTQASSSGSSRASSSGSSRASSSASSSSSSSSSSSTCSEVTVTDVAVGCHNTTISGSVYTVTCNETTTYKSTGCSLTPTSTTSTDPGCSVVTVTDVGVGCYNTTITGTVYATTCNQTTTFLSTGCSLTPTTTTTNDACLLNPNYDDPAILSDLSSWLAQFPMTLPPDFVNLTTTQTTPNATISTPASTSSRTTNITTITKVFTTVANSQSVVISEVAVVYGGSPTTISKTETEIGGSTSIPTDVTVSTIKASTSVTPSDGFATTTTDSYSVVYSVSEDVIGGTTLTVHETPISTLGPSPITPSKASTTPLHTTALPRPSLPSINTSAFSKASASASSASAAASASCAAFAPVQPSHSSGSTKCAVDPETNDYHDPYPQNSEFFWMNVTKSMVSTFCESLMAAPPLTDIPDGGGTCMTWGGSNVDGALPVAQYNHNVTFSVHVDPYNKTTSTKNCNSKVLDIDGNIRVQGTTVETCEDIFNDQIIGRAAGCYKFDRVVKEIPSDKVWPFGTSGGAVWQNCVLWTVVSVQQSPEANLVCENAGCQGVPGAPPKEQGLR